MEGLNTQKCKANITILKKNKNKEEITPNNSDFHNTDPQVRSV